MSSGAASAQDELNLDVFDNRYVRFIIPGLFVGAT